MKQLYLVCNVQPAPFPRGAAGRRPLSPASSPLKAGAAPIHLWTASVSPMRFRPRVMQIAWEKGGAESLPNGTRGLGHELAIDRKRAQRWDGDLA